MHTREKRNRPFLFRALRLVLILLLILLAAFAAFILFLTITEYKPADREAVSVDAGGSETLSKSDSIKIMSWNIGYGALGDNADFFMDGGSSVMTADEERVFSNMEGIMDKISSEAPDILFLQEVDRHSKRSHFIDEYTLLREKFPAYNSAYACNYRVIYVPYPIPPLGTIESGVAAYCEYPIKEAERIQLPIPFSWPVRIANLKRCLLISRLDMENSDKELVLVNLHIEAYDSGEGKTAQTKMLKDILSAELEKGNYVIAGGDFNQYFREEDLEKYPVQEGKWSPGQIDLSSFKDDWALAADSSVPTCRSLDQPYAGADKDSFQYYAIDGFLISKNLVLESCKTADLGFVCSDHNPVILELSFS